VEALFKTVLDAWGKIDILVNNAGIVRDGLLMRMKEEDWDAVLDINLKGAFLCVKAATRAMMRARTGRIVNISSITGLMGNPGQVNYTASKSGLIGLTKTVARELAGRGITANVVAPGFIPTEMTQDLSQDVKDKLLEQIPLGIPGKPEDIAAAVAFLVSDDAAYITGQVLVVDGGMVM
jgi:3-oxoacyl-[acyl-carrier protein] reductase